MELLTYNGIDHANNPFPHWIGVKIKHLMAAVKAILYLLTACLVHNSMSVLRICLQVSEKESSYLHGIQNE